MQIAHAASMHKMLKRGAPDLDLAILALAVEAEEEVAKDLGDIDRDVQGAHDARVAVGQAVLDVVERRVDQDAAVVPCRALDPDRLMDCGAATKVRQGSYTATDSFFF